MLSRKLDSFIENHYENNKSTHFAYFNHVAHSIKPLYTHQLFYNIINIVAN